MHAKHVEASATTPNKRRKTRLSAKPNSHTLFGGGTKPYKADSCQAVIVIETFSRGPVWVKGITSKKEKRYFPGDLNYVGGKSSQKKLTSVLLCDTTSAYLYAFKRADIKPHFVLPTEKASEYISRIVTGKIMELSAYPSKKYLTDQNVVYRFERRDKKDCMA